MVFITKIILLSTGLRLQLIIYIIQTSMSEAIQDMELGVISQGPYAILDHALRIGIFSNESTISYSDHQISITTSEKFDSDFQIITYILVQRREVSLHSSIMKNGEYLVINSSQLRKNLYRSFIKTSFQPYAKLLISQQGRLKIKMHSFLTTQVQFRQTKQTSKLYKFIEKLYSEMIDKFTVMFEAIKLMVEPVYQKRIYNNDDRLQKLDIIKNTCRFLYVKPSFMVSDGQRGKNNHQNLTQQFIIQSELDVSNIYDMKVISDKTVDNTKYNFFILLWQASWQLQKVQDTTLYHNFNLVKIKGMYKSSFKVPQLKSIKCGQAEQILSPIYINDIQKVNWVKIYQGGFGFLYKANVSFHFLKQKGQVNKKFLHERPIEKVMVLKTDKHVSSKSRVQLQKIMLKTLKGKKSRYLPNFYESAQNISLQVNYILTDFYPMKSLDCWFKNYGQFVSLFTKLSFLMYICHGIYFLHENDIVHRDLKIANILVDPRMMTKLIDFGQSYHEAIEPYLKSIGKDCRPGFTLPYSPPQIFSKSQQNTKKTTYDIFSLGFTIYQIIFGSPLLCDIDEAQLKKLYTQQGHLMDTKNSDQRGRGQSLIKQKIFLASQSLSYYGPIQILTPILNVIERCLDPKIQNRPYLEWVIVIIRQTYNNLLDFYSI